jgi:hypothetical protein
VKDIEKYTKDLIRELEGQKQATLLALEKLSYDRAIIEGQQEMLDTLIARAKAGFIFHELANPRES